MRPTKLTISAFGPYPDKVVIPMEDLGENGLYLICGDTGAGKTTIFDAICFALYGEASGSKDAGAREPRSLRSDFAKPDAETFVELEFAYRGESYRIKRNPAYMRPKKRGEGMKEETAGVELHRPNLPTLTKNSEVKAAIEELMGIDRDQFSQIVMIAQGEFRKLLTSETKERSEIFRKLFDTKAYEYFQAELEAQHSRLKAANQEIDNSVQNAARNALFSEESGRTEIRDAKIQDNQYLDDWLAEVLKSQITEDAATKEALESDQKALEGKRDALKDQLRIHSDLQAIVTQLAKHQSDRNEKLAMIPALQANSDKYTQLKPALEQIKQQAHSIRESLDLYAQHESLVGNAAKTQQELDSCKADIAKGELLLSALNKKIEEAEAASELFANAPANEERAKALLASRNDAKEQAEKLISQFLALEQLEMDMSKASHFASEQQRAFDDAKTARDEAASRTDKAKEALRSLESSEKEHAQAQAAEQDAARSYGEALKDQEEIQRKQADIHRETLALEHAQQKVEEAHTAWLHQANHTNALESARLAEQAGILASRLAPGKACPVCGSLEHPSPAMLSESAPTEKDIEDAKQEAERLHGLLSKASEAASKKKGNIDSLGKQLEEFIAAHGDENAIAARINEARTAHDKAQKLLEEAKDRVLAYRNAQTEASKAESALNASVKALEKATACLNEANVALAEKATAYSSRKDELEGQSQQDAEGKLNAAKQDVLEAKQMLSQAREERERLQKAKSEREEYVEKRNAFKTKVESLNASESKLTAEHASLSASAKAIESQLAYASKGQAEASLKELDSQAKAIEAATKKATEDLQAAKGQIDILEAKIEELEKQRAEKPQIDAEVTVAELNHVEGKLSEIKKSSDILNVRLSRNSDAAKDLVKAAKERKGIGSRLGDVAQLHQIASGTMSGKARLSFETYIQGIYFEKIIHAANRRLSILSSGRYELVRRTSGDSLAKKVGLDFNVFDNYTGKSRAATTLSGGESFQASLCLALGLSDVVQAYAGGIQLETMFIDEGFGSLDQESLNAAMNMLSTLSQENKLIGIISHVEELKDSIESKIIVTRDRRGSKLSMEV